ncbi:MAG: hypothetical protein KGI50_07810 [Patescibacteria group bacterium]|nr:hypothetical protein [Patescibacteria group bacterium]
MNIYEFARTHCLSDFKRNPEKFFEDNFRQIVKAILSGSDTYAAVLACKAAHVYNLIQNP